MIEYIEADKKYIESALSLLKKEYMKEKAVSSNLPDWNYDPEARQIITDIFTNGYTRLAVENGELLGYLSFWGPIDGFFGNVKGAWSPFGGSAFGGHDRAKTESRLFQEISKAMVKDGIFCYAISRSANDTEIDRSLVLSGFGIRCSDAIMKLDLRAKSSMDTGNIIFTELDKSQFKLVRPLKLKLTEHMWKAPTFFTADMSDIDSWLERDDIRIFAAKDKEKIIGFMSITDEGETFVTKESVMTNICGTYIEKEYRGGEVADAFLEYVCRTVESEGIKYLGVDCETLNPTALRFWGRHFQSYTYSYCRRIDERVINSPF